jgi:thiol-disulfide isomerase/thioredoxin
MLRVMMMLMVVVVALSAAEQGKATGFHRSLLGDDPLLFEQTGNRPAPRYLSYLSRQKYLFLYFGGSQCEPCKKLTPELITWYNAHGGGKDFEFILMGQDFFTDDIKAYMKTAGMPWLAFEKGKKFDKADPHFEQIKEKYGSKYVPTFVLLDENDEVVARSNDGDKYLGPEVVLKKYLELTKDQPPAYHASLFDSAPAFIDRSGSRLPSKYTSYLFRQKHLLLYFASNANAQSQKFTSELVTWYQANGGGDTIEVILIGKDAAADDPKTWMPAKAMPWLALAPEDANRARLTEKYGSTLMPTLVLLDENDEVVERSNEGEKNLGARVVLKKYLDVTKAAKKK